MSGVLVFAVLLLAPPILSLVGALRRTRRKSSRYGRAHRLLAAGVRLSAVALAYNAILFLLSSVAIVRGGVEMGWAHSLGLLLSWLCFWGWVAMHVLLRRRRAPSLSGRVA